MAESVVKLRVDSQEYDAKIRRAADGLRAFGENCQKAGESVAKADKDTLEYVRSIGQMETVSKTVRGKIGEMTTAFTELSVQYKNLTDEEKKSQFGVALSQSLDQLRTRIGESKAQLQEVSTELGNTSSKGNETGGIMQQLAGKFSFTVDAMKLFNIGMKAVEVALDVAKDAFFSSESQVDEWGRTVESGESLYRAFVNSLNSSSFSGFFSRMDGIIQKAREAYDAIDRLNTVMTIINPERAKLQARQQQLRETIRREGKDSAAGRQAQQQLLDLEPQLKASFRTEAGLNWNAFDKAVKERLAEGGINLDAKSYKILMDSFHDENAFKRLEQGARGSRTYVPGSSGTTSYGAAVDNGRWVDTRNTNRKLLDLFTDEWRQKNSAYLTAAFGAIGSASSVGLQNTRYVTGGGGGGGGRSGGGGGGGGRGGGGGTHQETPEEKAAKLVAAALGNYENAVSTATLRFEMGMDNSEEQQKKLLAAQERLTMAYADAYNITQDENYKTKFGEEAGRYNQMEDVVKGKRDLFNTATADLAGMSINPMEGILKGLLGEDMETYAKRKGIDLDTDKDKQGKKEDKALVAISNTIDGFSGGLSQITGGLEQLGIDVPNGIERMITTMQVISTILTGINSVVMTIAALSVIPFARGGIAHAASGLLIGHHYSGDMVPALLNDGELILNRSQQGNVASALRNNGLAGMQLEATLDGEEIRLAIRNGDRRRGRGEYAYSKTR